MRVLPAIVFACAVAATFCFSANAQATPAQTDEKPVAIKLLEIGNVSTSAFNVTIKKFVDETYDRQTALYIINYGSDREIARREKLIMNASWPHHRGSVILVRGGGKVGKTVVWKVPYGADNPVP